MSDELSDIRDAVDAILSDHGDDNRALWRTLGDTGFALLGVPEEIGGSGGSLAELAVVVRAAAHHGAAVPLAESAGLAGWLLAQVGLPVPAGLVAVSLDEARLGSGRLSGRCRVPWGRHADHVVTLARSDAALRVAVVSVAGGELARAENLAGEPRDVVTFKDVPVTAVADTEISSADLRRRGALLRSVQLAGAAGAVLESTRRHVGERVQFGRPLARFQAVQQQLAALAGQVTSIRVAADAAVLGGEQETAVAAAKATASAGAQAVTSIGHQLHGALGYSTEHPLGSATRRLWSWREEFGNEAYWQDRLAAIALGGGWWPTVTR
ncbi:acyl-CoA dehydrogenase family protein [Actinoplanes sp. NPDC048796]|uniref:acyl-CoA dehydrogenase family protein n=1 Tax=Actinoplanes sp. NPDC048796 TaxID=3155640 RepID=UPI0033DC0B41